MTGIIQAVTEMIEYLGRDGTMTKWRIDGSDFSARYDKCHSYEKFRRVIQFYREILTEETYRTNPSCLSEVFHFLGLRAFIRLGMLWKSDFKRCYTYYANMYAAEWAEHETSPQSILVGIPGILKRMLNCESYPVTTNFKSAHKHLEDNKEFAQIALKAFQDYWTPLLLATMEKGTSLQSISRKIGAGHVTDYIMIDEEKTRRYLQRIARQFTARRELISLRKINNFVFGEDSRTNFNGCNARFYQLLTIIAQEEFAIQNKRFVAENANAMEIHADRWVLYYRHGGSLRFRTIDFSEVHCPSIRMELKYYFRNRYCKSFQNTEHTYSLIFRVVNILCDHNPSIQYFADIDETDVRMLHTALENIEGIGHSTLMLHFFACRMVVDYLMCDERDPSLKTPRPHANLFRGLTFVNAHQYNRNTPYIPDKVLSQIEAHLHELPEEDQLVFQIFMETGMRAKEVAFLEESCLEKARHEGRVKLRYIPYKSLTARRRAGIEDYHYVYISEDLAAQIAQQSEKTKALRAAYNLPYIFLYRHTWNKTPVFNTTYFVVRINKLIEQHAIRYESGVLWYFSSRQCRKTLAVTMIENGATAEELTYQLGHLDASTAAKYYAEVKTMKLADLNRDFFKKQFDVLLSNESLNQFTAEERRQLYVDFRLGQRRVELGFCAKKLSEGGCKNRNRLYHCVACRQLCTGKKYLPYWYALLDSQKQTVQALLETYRAEGIRDYEDFMEYLQEKHLLDAYREMTQTILES
mgnify:FL=1